jgi:hypothetical protein
VLAGATDDERSDLMRVVKQWADENPHQARVINPE